MLLLHGKTGIVYGVANQHSLAWHITKATFCCGANLIITYHERFGQAEKTHPTTLNLLLCCLRCQDDEQIENV